MAIITITMTESERRGLAFLLQASDAMFPTGAYAHSLGLEEMVRREIVSDETSLLAFLRRHVIPGARHLDLPLAAQAHRAAANIEALLAVDRLSGALRPARELRQASLQTGRRRLAILASVSPTPILTAFHAEAERDPSVGHHAVVWGAACAQISLEASLTAYLYQVLSTACAAAPKLIRIGQAGAQRVLTSALADSFDAVDFAMKLDSADIGWFDPVLDLASMQHEIAHERLFIS